MGPDQKDIYEEMKQAVLDGDEDLAEELALHAMKNQFDMKKVMEEGFLKGIREAGGLYQAGEYFLPELVCAADAMKKALETLAPEMKKSSGDMPGAKGKILLATVQGDVHDIGKIIVGAMLTAAGYEVFDLGADVPNEKVIEKVREWKPDVLGLSALLTTTMEEQKRIIRQMEEDGLRKQIRVIVGGAPVNSKWAEQIRADGYSDDAMEAVKLVGRILG